MKYDKLPEKWRKVAEKMILSYLQQGYDEIAADKCATDGKNYPPEKVDETWQEFQDAIVSWDFEFERDATGKSKLIRV